MTFVKDVVRAVIRAQLRLLGNSLKLVGIGVLIGMIVMYFCLLH